jgi:hypothetical protein
MTSAAASGNGRYCYPLTVADGFSRYLLGCCGIGSWASQRPSLGEYVTGIQARDRATVAGGR